MIKLFTGRGNDHQRQLLENLSLPLALEEAGPPRATLQLVTVLTLLVVAALVWAGVTQVRQVAVTTGQVIPAAPLQPVQHLEGGIVEEVFIEEGTTVSAGQPLLRLQAASAGSDLEQLRAREAALGYRVESLSAYVEDRRPSFDRETGFPALRADQLDVLSTRREADASRREVLQSQADQKRLELEGLRNRQASLRTQLDILGEQLAVREQLLAKGLISRLVVLDTHRAVAALQADLVETDADVAQAGEAIREIETRLVEFDTTSTAEAVDEMTEAAAELAEVREAIAKLQDRFTRLVVHAPADGVVQGLTVEAAGL